MTAEPMGPLHSRLAMDHEELDTLLEQLIAAYETNDRDIAASAYKELEERLPAHLAAEESLLFPEFARVEPEETNLLRSDHQQIRDRVFELGIGVDLHQTRIGAIRELAQMLRAHAARENELLYRWADRVFSDPTRRPDLNVFFAHGRSPAAPVQS
jgi:hemerythrin-like domain-containing protein